MKFQLDMRTAAGVLFRGEVEAPSAMAAIRLQLAGLRISEAMSRSVRQGLRIDAWAENGKAESRKPKPDRRTLNPEVWRA